MIFYSVLYIDYVQWKNVAATVNDLLWHIYSFKKNNYLHWTSTNFPWYLFYMLLSFYLQCRNIKDLIIFTAISITRVFLYIANSAVQIFKSILYLDYSKTGATLYPYLTNHFSNSPTHSSTVPHALLTFTRACVGERWTGRSTFIFMLGALR